ncbi:MAG: PRC-barrel domain-containing protein [Pirellulales bacterium]
MSMRLVTFSLCLALCAGGSAALGQRAADDQPSAAADEQRTKKQARQDDAEDTQAAMHRAARISKIMGMKVVNTAGEELGTVDDLMLDLRMDGGIRYAALSYGGFLGLGDKLFAVPWKAFEYAVDEDEEHLVLDINEERLKKSPGFDKDAWPDFADPKWSSEVDVYFNNESDTAAGTTAPADRSRRARDDEARESAYPLVHRASKVVDMEARSGDGEQLGKIDDLVVDTKSGKLRYAALSFGGFLGVGDKLFAIPWEAFKIGYDPDDDKYYLTVLDLTEEQLKNAPGFDKDRWPDFADPQWSVDIDEYYKSDAEKRPLGAARPKETTQQ